MIFNVDHFLIELQQLDIYLWVEDGQLAFDAPDDAFTDAIREKVLAHKQEIMQALLESELITSQPIDKAARTETLPLSFAQQRLWFLDQLEPNSAYYNLLEMIRLQGQLDVVALEQSFTYLVARHESLRTTFDSYDGEPIQVIHPPSAFTLSVMAVSSEQEAQRGVQVAASTPFNLSQGPLLRVQLLKYADDDHFLLLTMHHIISDGWSMGVLIEELTHAYAAYVQGNVPTLPELPIQYADFAVWQRDYLSGDTLDRQLSFWREQLAGAPEQLELPTDRPRPPVQSYRGAHYTFQLDADLTAKLNQLAVRHEATLFMVLHSAFSVLLSRYSRQTDIVIGTPIANRNRAEIEGLIGFFVNSLVLRTELDDNPSFSSLLYRVRTRTLAAYEHQDLPFEQLVNELQPTRSLSVSPLFQVMLVLQNAEMGTFALPDPVSTGTSLTATPHLPEFPFAKFDLSLFLTESDLGLGATEGLRGMLEYSTDLFDEATIARMASHFALLLDSIVAHPDKPVLQLPMLTTAEYHQIVHQWNDTAVRIPPQTIHALFEAQVRRTPLAVALVFGDEQLTYHELNRRANQLAHYLQAQGVGADVLVGICIERSVEMVVGMLGILKAGGAYLPLDPSVPGERLAFMLEDAQVSIVLTEEKLIESLSEQAVELFSLDSYLPSIALQSSKNPPNQLGPDSLAYVIYTSGSTGRPKGVMVPHRGINRLVNKTNYIEIRASDRMAQASNASFDAATFEIWGALLHGACLVGIPHEVAISPPSLATYLVRQDISILFLTTALFNQVVSHAPDAFSNLRYLLFGGEAVDPVSVRTLLRHASVANYGAPEHFLHVYGPTENTTYSSWYPIKSVAENAITVPIGRAIANSQIYILDGQLSPVPVGVPGELYLAGSGLALGYLNRPKLTQQSFIPNPFGRGKLYKTGDLCRYLPASRGNIEFIGRTDFQVKIRGFRIELGEIESALRAADGVREAVVLAREDNAVPGDKRLVAYVVGDADSDTLRTKIAQRLPDYMVPSAFVRLDAMPLTPNGKVDRRGLPAPNYADAQTEFVAPRNALEQQLADIWADVLGVKQVGIDDNFFSLGGHSLLATQVISRVRAQLNLDIPLKSLFETSQLAAFARHISQTEESITAIIRPRPEGTRRDGQLPLSFAQQRLWFLDQLEPESALYNIPMMIRLEGELDVVALEQSFTYLMARHESLRTTFGTVNGEAIQVIHEPTGAYLPIIALSSEEQAMKLGQVEAETPFNLREGPLLRVRLFKLADNEHFLLLTMHHIISDGWSTGLLVSELTHAYKAYAQSDSPTLPELPIQYADFAVWQRHYLSGETLDRQLSFWREQLTGAPAQLTLPTDRPRPLVQSYRGAHYTFQLDAELTAKLNQLAGFNDATLFMLLLSAFNVLLSRYSRQTDIVIGTPIANRNRAEIEGLIGFFVNTLTLRTQLDDNPSFTELLARVRETTLAAYEHQDLPFEQLVDELELTRTLSVSPLFQVMFALQNAEIKSFALPGIRATPHLPEFRFAKFDLTLTLIPSDDGLMGALEYNTDLFDEATIARMASHFALLLDSIVAHPDKPVQQLPMLREAEYHQILHQWNDTAVDFGEPQTIHAMFEQQVERTPNAVALIFEDQQLTYSELNARANQLAHHLISLGVQADTLVAVAMERSIELVVGLLAVLKAGGAYVPIDPTYPRERIGYMLTDSAAPIVLTQFHLELHVESKHVIAIDQVGAQLALNSRKNPQISMSPKDLAYVIYTSGSTGEPKGVAIPHQNVTYHLDWLIGQLQMTNDDVILQKSPVSFDASVWEIFAPLLCGAQLVLAPVDVPRDIYQLHQSLQNAITIVQLVPTQLRLLLDQGDLTQYRALRQLVCGGEQLTGTILGQVFSQSSHLTLHNFYGPTETTIQVVCWSTQRAVDYPPIGQPVANTQAYILDENGNVQPLGVPGTLYIGGIQLARGYLNRPELTAERFIEHPQFGRLYKTGDLCRWLPGGNIEFIGRTDFQVKIRGFRIELGEIESALRACDGVREAVVLAREDNPDDKRLVAYLVGDADSDALRAKIAQRLPEYMVPKAFMTLEAMPLTPNGKLDRRALPAPDYSPRQRGASAQTTFVAPRNEVEASLAHVFADVLRLPQIGIHDDFFRMGGDSILSIQVVSRAAQQGYTLSVKDVFQNPTIAQLASVIRTEQPSVQASQAVQIGAVPLLPIQRRFLAGNQPEMHHFNQSFLLTVKQPIDPVKLSAAIRALLRHHDALRCKLGRDESGRDESGRDESGWDESGWHQQYLAPRDNVPLEVVDLQAIPHRYAQIEATCAQAQTSLNPLTGDLTRWLYFRSGDFDLNGDGDNRLLIVIHHLAVDGVSWRILLEDLATLLDGGQLAPKTSSYRDWGQALQSATEHGHFDAQISHWLTGATVTKLPLEQPDALNSMGNSHDLMLTLSGEQTLSLLRTLPDLHEVTLDAVLLTALTETLTDFTEQSALRVKFESYGRQELFESINLNRTVGWFTSAYPLTIPRFSGSAVKRIRYTLDQLRRVTDGGISFGALRYFHPDEAIRSQFEALPSAEVVYNYLGQLDSLHNERFGVAQESTGLQISENFRRDTLIDSNALVINGKLHINWTVSPQIRRETADSLLATFKLRLSSLISAALKSTESVAIPTDFEAVTLSIPELETLQRMVDLSEVQTVMALSPMQEGMLFHSQLAPNSGSYIEHALFHLHDATFDAPRLVAAMQRVIDRHDALRATFETEGLSEAVQVIHRQAPLPVTHLDWRRYSADDSPKFTLAQQARLSQLIEQDRRTDFDFSQAPLLRLTVIQRDEERYDLLFTFHHLLMDRWSVDLFWSEVLRAYSAERLPKATPYQSYIEHLQLKPADPTFWQDYLSGFYAPTPLPGATNATNQGQSTSISQTISASATLKLTTFARQQGLTVNTLFQAAWAVLLARYGRESDVLFGMVTSGRTAPLRGIESIVGLFINTLPLRVQLDTQLTGLDLLHQVAQSLLDIQQREHTSLVDVQRESEVPAGIRLFDSLFLFQNTPQTAKMTANGLDLRLGWVEPGETGYPLVALAAPGIPGEVASAMLALTYDTAYLDAHTAERLLTHWQQLLMAIVSHPFKPVLQLPMLTTAEYHQIVHQWNDTAVRIQPQTIHALFEAQVRHTPLAVALIFGDEQLTYAELNARANQLAHYLRENGVMTETPVGVCLNRHFDLIISTLAIIKAGGAYVPLDPTYPRPRLQFMVRDTGLRLILTEGDLIERVPVDAQLVDVKRLDLQHYPQGSADVDITSDNLLYIMYTSGSTGEPKGIEILHRNVQRLVKGAKFAQLDATQTFLQLASPSFDASTLEIWGSLCNGARLVLYPEQVIDLRRVGQLIQTHQISILWLTAGLFHQMVDHHLEALSGVRQLLAGGDVLSVAHICRLLKSASKELTLINGYGPTENTTFTTTYRITDLNPQARSVPIGVPISNTQVYILDQAHHLTPIGVPGELYAGGLGVARGYLNRPELTAERFIEHPQFGRLYKTGDLCRWLPASRGNIEFMGRTDFQVKIRGFRIELGEIESALLVADGVREAVVLAREDNAVRGDKRLVAYVVGDADSDTLRTKIAQRLPNYMIPSAFVRLDAMPLTPNGKLDRRALPAPEYAETQLAYVPPRNELEQQLADIWADVLGVKQVGIHDNFFALGGHSLLATQLVSHIRRQLNLHIPIKTIFETTSLAELAKVLDLSTSYQTAKVAFNEEDEEF